jgi:hypothetical protein
MLFKQSNTHIETLLLLAAIDENRKTYVLCPPSARVGVEGDVVPARVIPRTIRLPTAGVPEVEWVIVMLLLLCAPDSTRVNAI